MGPSGLNRRTAVDYVVRGGTVVTARGAMRADLWVRGGKVERIVASDEEQETVIRDVPALDAEGAWITPGWVLMNGSFAAATSAPYREQLGAWIRRGVTTVVEAVDPRQGPLSDVIDRGCAVHFNSCLDYGLKLDVPFEAVNRFLFSYAGRHGLRLVDVRVRDPQHFGHSRWGELLWAAKNHGLRLVLRPDSPHPQDSSEGLRWLSRWAARASEGVSGYTPPVVAWPFERPDRPVSLPEGLSVACTLTGTGEGVTGDPRVIALCLPEEPAKARWDVPAERAHNALVEAVRLLATNPAKLAGLYPQKGCLAPGSDADFLLFRYRDGRLPLFAPDAVAVRGVFVGSEPFRALSPGSGRLLSSRPAHLYALSAPL